MSGVRDREFEYFEGVPLNALKNVPTSEFYISEDPTSFVPQPYVGESNVLAWSSHENSPNKVLNPDISEAILSRPLGNPELPAWAKRKEIADAVLNNQITIVEGPTGSGKTTQSIQFLLDADFKKITLTQPRVSAARGIFERAVEEIGLVRGSEVAEESVAYRTAHEHLGPENATIEIVTDGLYLARDVSASTENDGDGDSEVLIVDEVHEWNCNEEVIVASINELLIKKPKMKIVIMSATMESSKLVEHFTGTRGIAPPIVKIEGRNYHVEQQEKPEGTVIDEALALATSKDKDAGDGILIFMPGKREIADAVDELARRLPAGTRKNTRILPFHSKLPSKEQQEVFRDFDGQTIIVSTNLAQTSLTIPYVKHVIDSGLERHVELDAAGVQGLVLRPISQADCLQRAGRAGRVSDGTYTLTRLDRETNFVSFEDRAEYPTPEILRTDIVRNVLRIAGSGLDIRDLDFFHPVEHASILNAEKALRNIGAFDDNNNLTPLGMRMNRYPLGITNSRTMAEAARFNERTRLLVAIVTSSKEVGGLQNFTHGASRDWRNLVTTNSSDMLAYLDIMVGIQDMTPRDIEEHGLDYQAVENARKHYRKVAKIAGVTIIPDILLPPTEQERSDIVTCIAAGMIGSVFRHQGAGVYLSLTRENDEPRTISNRSVLFGGSSPSVVVGNPYRVEYRVSGDIIPRHIIEHGTAVSLAEIGRLATAHTEWRTDGFVRRGGQLMELQRQYLFGEDSGITQEVIANPSPKTRAAVIANVFANPGPVQRYLRSIKSEIEQLTHLAKDPIMPFTHDMLVNMIHEATPPDATDVHTVDNNLAQLIAKVGFSLDFFCDQDRRVRIIANAPPQITIENGMVLNLNYRSGKAFVDARKFKISDILKFEEEVYLPDGRKIHFQVKEDKRSSRLVSLVQLKRYLGLL